MDKLKINVGTAFTLTVGVIVASIVFIGHLAA